MNWIQKEIKEFIEHNGYATTINAQGFVVVADPVQSSHGNHTQPVVIKSYADAAKFISARS